MGVTAHGDVPAEGRRACKRGGFEAGHMGVTAHGDGPAEGQRACTRGGRARVVASLESML